MDEDFKQKIIINFQDVNHQFFHEFVIEYC